MLVSRPVVRRRAELTNVHGLHLRPAARFAELAQRFVADVRVVCDGTEANGKSVLDLIGLAAEAGKVLDLEAQGADAEQAVHALAELVQARFHEVEECQVA